MVEGNRRISEDRAKGDGRIAAHASKNRQKDEGFDPLAKTNRQKFRRLGRRAKANRGKAQGLGRWAKTNRGKPATIPRFSRKKFQQPLAADRRFFIAASQCGICYLTFGEGILS